ncbi:PREDICTED: uncharacterized protein LOC106814539 [Priapulus caudatus]|uniref:Uncharacterized protein LOC106814539 n=1 Tax=Priapulus caudatus TaxID=37621 RepID=A0ABM1EQ70_PRICU|nr:PREDICTED: uncharacterized protein LOC106814539 [Priapulus caudatus]
MDLHAIELHLTKLTRMLKKNVHPYYEAVPLGAYDGQLDNTDSPYPSFLQKFIEISDTYEDSIDTDTGMDREVAIAAEAESERQVYALGLPDKVAALFSTDAAEGKAFDMAYGHVVAVGVTQGIEVNLEVPAGQKAMINIFLDKDIYVIKWRAQFLAAGFVTIKWCDRWATIHLTQILDQRQREFFAFGTVKYHERFQYGAKVTFYDKHGHQIGPEPTPLRGEVDVEPLEARREHNQPLTRRHGSSRLDKSRRSQRRRAGGKSKPHKSVKATSVFSVDSDETRDRRSGPIIRELNVN